jgi:hypothetical protein
MKCPKCGMEQPEAQVCAGCGIVIEKYLARQRMAANPEETVKSAVQSVAKQLQTNGFYFNPDVPAEQWQGSLSAYPSEEAVGQGEEILALLPEPVLGSKTLNLMDNTLLTTRRIVQVSRINSNVRQINWKDIRTVSLAGLLGDKLKINNADILVGALVRLDGGKKQLFLNMIKNLIRNLNQPGPGQLVKVTRLTDYPSIKQGSLRVAPAQPTNAKPETATAVEPAKSGGNEVPAAITPGKAIATQVRMSPAVKAYVPPPPPGAAQAAEDDVDLKIEEVPPPPPVSPSRWIAAQGIGFIVGSLIGMPVGIFIGEILHFKAPWPRYLGIFLAVLIWTGVTNAIKGAGASKEE